MILVREIFQLQFGKAREAVAKVKEALTLGGGPELRNPRILTDLTGEYYTLVWESEFPDLATFEQELGSEFEDPRWREWYEGFVPLIQSGRREIFTIVE